MKHPHYHPRTPELIQEPLMDIRLPTNQTRSPAWPTWLLLACWYTFLFLAPLILMGYFIGLYRLLHDSSMLVGW